MNSLKIYWNHLVCKDTFCCKQFEYKLIILWNVEPQGMDKVVIKFDPYIFGMFDIYGLHQLLNMKGTLSKA
jgi:hypothetical protein